MTKIFDNYDFKIPDHGVSLRWRICDHMNKWYEVNLAAYEELVKLDLVDCVPMDRCEYIYYQFVAYQDVLYFLLDLEMLNKRTCKKVIDNVHSYMESLKLIIEKRKDD